MPLRHWFFLIHQMYLAQSGLPDDELERYLGLDQSEIMRHCLRISTALKQQGVPAGQDLKPALGGGTVS